MSFRPAQFCYPTPRTTAGCQSRVARHATSGRNPGVGEVGRGWGWGRGGLCLELNSVLSVRSGGGRLCRAARLETEGPRRAAGPGRAGAGLWARRRRQRSHTAQHLAHSLSSCLPGVLAAACWHPRQVSRVKSSTTPDTGEASPPLLPRGGGWVGSCIGLLPQNLASEEKGEPTAHYSALGHARARLHCLTSTN